MKRTEKIAMNDSQKVRNKIHKSNIIYLQDNKYKNMSEDECLVKVLKKHIKTAK